MNNISFDSIKTAIDHIVRYGDTDIFPHLIEIAFLSEEKEKIAAELSILNMSTFVPVQSIEALAPKSRYGFRIANQLVFLDCVVLTSALIEIANDLEKLRQVSENSGPFSYRFENNGNGSIFDETRTYRDWISEQERISQEKDFEEVVFTDIADFYQRIYFHRIENVLRSSTPKKHIASLIEKIIRHIRSKQSYGIPVGGSASRLLAEAVLSDFDHALEADGYYFTRFVDDVRIYINSDQDSYTALSFAAETLLSEGLTLNAQKTKVLSKDNYIEFIRGEGADAFEEAERDALNAIANSIYFEEDKVDPSLINLIQSINLQNLLEHELEGEIWDFGKIRAILRAMRLVGDAGSVSYILQNLSTLLPFIKDIVILLSALQADGKLEDIDVSGEILSHLNDGAGLAVPVIRAWLLESFVRGVATISNSRLNTIARTNEIDGRQIVLIHGVNNNVAFFRKNKTRFESFSKYEQYAFVIGASCLPRDEYETWIGAIRNSFSRPIDSLFLEWSKSKQGKIKDVIASLSEVSDVTQAG